MSRVFLLCINGYKKYYCGRNGYNLQSIGGYMRILVVEDEKDMNRILAKELVLYPASF